MLPQQTGTGFGEEHAISISGLMPISAIQPQMHSDRTEAAKFRW